MSKLYQRAIDSINDIANDKDLEKEDIIDKLDDIKKEIDVIIVSIKEDIDEDGEEKELVDLHEEDLTELDLDKTESDFDYDQD